MTTINNPEDFLRVLSENPQWKAAVRAQILGEELLQLPVRFDAFALRQTQFNDQVASFITEQRQINGQVASFITEQRQINGQVASFITEQRQINDRIDRRLNTMSNDIGSLKGAHARSETLRVAAVIALDMGLQYIRTMPMVELAQMAQNAAGGDIPTHELRSFRYADAVIEATDGSNLHYIAVEASYTADQRDTDRAQRNARFLAQFTGCITHSAIASVRNDHTVEEQIASGAIHWHEIVERDLAPE